MFWSGEGIDVTIVKHKTKPKVKHILLDNFRRKTWPTKSVLGDNRPGENGGLHFQSMASTLQVGRWEESEVTQVISTFRIGQSVKARHGLPQFISPSVSLRWFTCRLESASVAFGSNVVTWLICLPNKLPSRRFYEAGI